MVPQKIISLIERYEQELAELGISKERMDPSRTFASLSREEALAHAHFLCSGVKEYAAEPKRKGKTGRHLASVQLCLSFAGLYTLQDLMEHNKP
jgi:hypothetical protein